MVFTFLFLSIWFRTTKTWFPKWKRLTTTSPGKIPVLTELFFHWSHLFVANGFPYFFYTRSRDLCWGPFSILPGILIHICNGIKCHNNITVSSLLLKTEHPTFLTRMWWRHAIMKLSGSVQHNSSMTLFQRHKFICSYLNLIVVIPS